MFCSCSLVLSFTAQDGFEDLREAQTEAFSSNLRCQLNQMDGSFHRQTFPAFATIPATNREVFCTSSIKTERVIKIKPRYRWMLAVGNRL